jgi:transcriptional regulator GlxA family with amidase domain
MRSRIAEPWNLDALAEEVHLSRSQVVRAFNATIGMSPDGVPALHAGRADGSAVGVD